MFPVKRSASLSDCPEKTQDSGLNTEKDTEKDYHSQDSVSRKFNAFEIGMGVGKGVYGRAIATSRKVSGLRGLISGKYFTHCYCIPGEARYPRYNSSLSVKSLHELPPILTEITHLDHATCMISGPDEGFVECAIDVENRKKELNAKSKQLQHNPNAFEGNTLSVSELTLEEIKRKKQLMKTLEKKIKKITPHFSLLQTSLDPRIYGKTIDTYAFDVIKGQKAGQPNADSFYAESFGNQIFFGVADGIGWGVPSRRASQSALLGFMISLHEYNGKEKGEAQDTERMAQACYEALEAAHVSVYCNTESKTTFCGGILIELPETKEEVEEIPFDRNYADSDSESADDGTDDTPIRPVRWIFVGISVGDSLIYRYSQATANVIELTVSDRTGGVRDAGGCLGGKEPDLRNLTFHCCLAEEGDIFLAVSDGVHDNLDPEVLQCNLEDTGYDVPEDVRCWGDLNANDKNKFKRRFKEEKLLEIIENADDVTPQSITNAIISEIEEMTRLQRKGYEEGSRLQRDWDKMEEKERNDLNKWVQATLKNPKGKFDHVTCLCVQVAKGS